MTQIETLLIEKLAPSCNCKDKCNCCKTQAKVYYRIQKEGQLPRILCKKCLNEEILTWHETHGYGETALRFGITILELKKKILMHNCQPDDAIFLHCDHHFHYEEILHKHGVETTARCILCGLNTAGSKTEIYKAHPHCHIQSELIEDCSKARCPFCL
jgi:hypothetical protein